MQPDGAGFVLNAEIPLAVARGSGGGVRLASFSPAGKSCKERLDGCIHGVGMEQLIRIGSNEPHEMAGFEPEAFVPDRAPEEEQRAAIDLATRMSQFIELGGSAQVNPAHAILRFRFRLHLRCTHIDFFFLACLNAESQGLKPRKTRLSAQPEGTAACGGFNGVTVCQVN